MMQMVKPWGFPPELVASGVEDLLRVESRSAGDLRTVLGDKRIGWIRGPWKRGRVEALLGVVATHELPWKVQAEVTVRLWVDGCHLGAVRLSEASPWMGRDFVVDPDQVPDRIRRVHLPDGRQVGVLLDWHKTVFVEVGFEGLPGDVPVTVMLDSAIYRV